MKFYLSVFTLVIICTSAFAQQNTYEAKTSEIIQQIITKQTQQNAANKTTGLSKRLVGIAVYRDNFISDSIHYFYSNGRGSQLSAPNTYRNTYYNPGGLIAQNIFCDKTVYWYTDPHYVFRINGQTLYNYNSNNQTTNIFYGSSLIYNLTYNTNNKVSKVAFYNFSITPYSELYILYDAKGRRGYDYTIASNTGDTTARSYFAYDANDNLLVVETHNKNAANTWYVNYQLKNTYDNNNRIIKSTTKYSTGGVLSNAYQDTFSYNGAARYPSYHRQDFWASFSWMPESLEVAHLNTQNLPDSICVFDSTYTSTTADTISMTVYEYDSSELFIQKDYRFEYQNGVFNPLPFIVNKRYYYEEHFPVSIATTQANDIDIKIYPNPANNLLHIDADPLEDVSLNIYDYTGRILISSFYNKLPDEVDIHELAAGNYILSISNTKNEILCTNKFIKE